MGVNFNNEVEKQSARLYSVSEANILEERLLMLPGPTQVPERVLKAMIKPVINHRGELWRELYRKVQKGLKYVFQTENDVYTLTNSGTGGVECAISNLVAKGDKVIVPTNGEFGIRVSDTVERFGGEAIRVEADWGDRVDPQKIKEALDRNPNTKMIAFVYNETSTGVRNPAKELIKIAKDHNVLVFCDAVSNLAGDYLYMDDWDVDVVVTGSQKCLACPPGLAFISLNQKAWKKVEDNKNKANFYLDLIKLRRFHEKSETPFTPAVSVFFALDEALKMIEEEGIENRIERHHICAKGIREGVKAIGLKLFPKDEKFASDTVNAIANPEGIDDFDVRRHLLTEYGIAIAGGIGPTKGKIIRIGTMGQVSRQNVLDTLDAVEDALHKLGYDFERGKAVEMAKSVFQQ